ncbi:leucine-rich repeat domain-containing protein [Tenacibaculum aiptasiae]|uniref:leucine-rich repeat domain-containing protein n=1 Tax=Tenacibaculum aiptasiae TaxID=426481 RepID=UPI00232EB81E|nr:hypothetical protein [Tenacibaculum aiptasiae]
MKTYISLWLSLFLCANLFSQETIRIPDIGLEECLIDLDIDSNGLNGNILVSDAAYVVNLNINNPITNKLLPNVHSKIKDLTGLESFPNLKRLDCFGNNITKIDLSKSKSITFLNCSENQIESLDLSNNTELVYVSCDNNKLSSLILGNNDRLETLYCSFNNLTELDLKGCHNLENLDATSNKIEVIVANDSQLNNIPSGWYKDKSTSFANKALETLNTGTVVKNTENTHTPQNTTPQKKVETPKVTTSNESSDSAANYYEKFQLSVITEYDKLVLDQAHLDNKKVEVQQKYQLNPEQLTQWIAKYSNLKANNSTSNASSQKKSTITHYSKFKRAAVEEYEKLVLSPAYLQSKKEEIQKKYKLNPEQFAEWINSFGTPSLKAKTEQPQETTDSHYTKFKKAVVSEYDAAVLNPTYILSKKKEVQQKYKLTPVQLNEWIKKHSKIRS